MLTFEKAVDILHNNLQNVLIYECGENDTFFFFGIQPQRLWGTDEMPSGGSTHVVWKKTAKYDLINFDLWNEEEYNKIIIDDYPTKIDYSEIPLTQAVISKEELTELIKKKGFSGTVVGYDFSSETQRIFPRYRLPDNPRDIPTDGGTYYYDLKLQSWGWMDLLEYCDYSGLKTIRFDSFCAAESKGE